MPIQEWAYGHCDLQIFFYGYSPVVAKVAPSVLKKTGRAWHTEQKSGLFPTACCNTETYAPLTADRPGHATLPQGISCAVITNHIVLVARNYRNRTEESEILRAVNRLAYFLLA